MIRFGQYPAPSHVFAHISDTHLLAGGARQFGSIDTEANLVRAIDRLLRIDPAPDALIFTGDLADLGEPAAYQRLRGIVEPAAEAMGAQIIWVIGNHDERPAYARELFGAESGDEVPADAVYDVKGVRVISLDTTVPGWHHGDLTPAQLAWLADVLSTPAKHGTILALHHPPIPTPMSAAAELIELVDQQRLADVLAGTDVVSILGGHFHYTSHSTFAGIPVSVAAATCNLADPAPLMRFDSVVDDHQSVNLVHVYADRVVHTVVPLPESPEVIGHPSSVADQLAALPADVRHDLVCRKDSPLNTGQLQV